MHKLLIQDDEGKTTEVPLVRDELSIGRREGNTIRLTERNVSRKHAVVSKQNGHVSIEDLDSYNGIRINGTRIDGKVQLKESDRVQIGDYVLQVSKAAGKSVSQSSTITKPLDRPDELGKTVPMNALTPAATADLQAEGSKETEQMRMPGSTGEVKTAQPLSQPAQNVAGEQNDQNQPAARLVILSNNFAGDEFKLGETKTVIGRTDDNDIWLDHRSISRHHAQVVREGESYLIEDLGSANGVRVNGEEYDRVELRKGDLVDLGHVRFRFLEAGEDFLFGRDAQGVDIGPRGGRGLLWAAALALVAAGAALFVWTQNGGAVPGLDSDGSASDTDTLVADNGAPDSVEPDKTATGTEAVQKDPPVEPVEPPAKDPALIELEKALADAKAAVDSENWADVLAQSEKARKLDPQNQIAKQLGEQATLEEAQARLYKKFEQCSDKDLRCIRQRFAKIDDDSVYKSKAQGRYDTAGEEYTGGKVREVKRKLSSSAWKTPKFCEGKISQMANQAGRQWEEAKGEILALRSECAKIKPAVASVKKPSDSTNGSDSTPKVPPKKAEDCTDTLKCAKKALKACKEGRFAEGEKIIRNIPAGTHRNLANDVCANAKAVAGQ